MKKNNRKISKWDNVLAYGPCALYHFHLFL